MAGASGKPTSRIIKDLIAEGRHFSFFQALRLLCLNQSADTSASKTTSDDRLKTVRVRPELSLAFPASDIAEIKKLPSGEYRITATFLGLYGTSSPLPSFYTEDLFYEQRDDTSASRDFLDIFNHRLYSLLFQCWKKYRPLIQIVEQRNQDDLERFCAISGMGGTDPYAEGIDDVYPLLRYTGIFSQHPRSTLGLKTVIKDYLGGLPVEVISCIERDVMIPHEQKLRLGASGSCLGVDSFLGDEIKDRQGKFRVQIGPVHQDRFSSILQGGPEHDKLVRLIGMYLTDPLEYDFELILHEQEAQHACLGGTMWSRLGLDTVLYTGDKIGEVTVVFPPET